jgi:hypothetical protein
MVLVHVKKIRRNAANSPAVENTVKVHRAQ